MRLSERADDTIDTEAFSQMVDTFLDAAFNYFDTAHTYLGQPVRAGDPRGASPSTKAWRNSATDQMP